MIRSALLWPVKVGLIAAALWYVLRDPLPTPADWIVAIAAAVLLHLAYAAIRTEFRRSGDVRLLQKAGFGEPPADGQRVALVGSVKTTGPAVRTPFSGTDCAGYSYEIYHFEYTRGGRGSSGTHRQVPDFSGVALAPCVIRTPQGDFALLSFPFLSGFPEHKYKDDLHRDRAAEYIRATTFAKTVPYVGELAALDRAMLETEGSLKKDWRMAGSDDLGEATFEEHCIPLDAQVCAFGIYSDEKHALVPDTSSDSRALLLVAGDAVQAAAQLTSGIGSSRRLAVAALVPAMAVVAFILFAPWNVLRATPGGSLIIDKQTGRLKDALSGNDLREMTAAIRYLDPNLAFEEASRTPLMLATTVEAAQLLIARGANVAAHDSNGYSVLMNAAERGSPDLLAFLAVHGADVNERLAANPEITPLSIARERNTPDAVAALLKAGAREER